MNLTINLWQSFVDILNVWVCPGRKEAAEISEKDGKPLKYRGLSKPE